MFSIVVLYASEDTVFSQQSMEARQVAAAHRSSGCLVQSNPVTFLKLRSIFFNTWMFILIDFPFILIFQMLISRMSKEDEQQSSIERSKSAKFEPTGNRNLLAEFSFLLLMFC